MSIKVAVIGFITGAFVLPSIITLGLGIRGPERLAPLIAPGISVAKLFQREHSLPNTICTTSDGQEIYELPNPGISQEPSY